MKCIYCDTDSNLRERSDGACKKCHHPFAFEPNRTMGLPYENANKKINYFKVTDPSFKKAIEAVSENHTVFFTPRQLYYQLLRPRSRPVKYKASAGAGSFYYFIVGLLAVMFSLVVLKLGVLALAIAAAFILVRVIVGAALPRYKGIKLASKALISYNYFQYKLLNSWIRAHGAPPKLLPEGGRLRPALRQGSPEADIQSYSFERLLVCDKPETADMLLANNLHFETNTPIVSIDGYPQDVFESVLKMVRRNPNLKVFALHDADPQGCMLPLRLREDPRWFPDPAVKIFDIGLRPRQVATMPDLIVTDSIIQLNQPPTTPKEVMEVGRKFKTRLNNAGRIELPAELKRMLSPGERNWLEGGYRVELAAIKPARLMKAIYQSFNRAAEEEAGLRAYADNDPRGFFQTGLPGMPPPVPAIAGGFNPANSAPPPVRPDARPYPPGPGAPPPPAAGPVYQPAPNQPPGGSWPTPPPPLPGSGNQPKGGGR